MVVTVYWEATRGTGLARGAARGRDRLRVVVVVVLSVAIQDATKLAKCCSEGNPNPGSSSPLQVSRAKFQHQCTPSCQRNSLWGAGKRTGVRLLLGN